jgi:hypothetical protein
MSVQAKGAAAAIVPATIQTPKAIIPTEIKNESTVSMMGKGRSRRLVPGHNAGPSTGESNSGRA